MTWLSTTVSMCIKGGIFMIPLCLVALAAIALIIERLLYLKENRVDGDKFHFELKSALKENAVDQAITMAARTKGVIGRVVEEGLLRVRSGETDVEAATEKVILTEMTSMEKSRGWLVTLSQLAPLLGILGTVWGLVVAFMAIEQTASTDPRILASGIYQALITTIAGLLIAIPIIAFVEYLRKETNYVLNQLDLYLAEIREWVRRQPAKEGARHGQA
jgi:biopolymer transport protein ExbB